MGRNVQNDPIYTENVFRELLVTESLCDSLFSFHIPIKIENSFVIV